MASMSRPIKSYQPLALLYNAYSILAMVVSAPVRLIVFRLFPSSRPHRSYSLGQSMMIRIVRDIVDATSTLQKPTPLPLKPQSAEGDRFLVLQPYAAGYYQGILGATPSVTPAPIGGTWYYPPQKQQTGALSAASLGPDDAVILHIHGGAFIMGDGRDPFLTNLTKNTLAHSGPNVAAMFCPSYRLACRPGEDPFPAALQDTLTSYLYLVKTLGISPRNIIIAGDSAGGNLCIGLLRYLAEHGSSQDLPEKLPNPTAAVLWSPWINVARCGGPGGVDYMANNPNFVSDVIPLSFPKWGADAYSHLVDAEDPHITPLGHPFATPVPMFVNYGSAELLNADGTQWIHEMSGVEGNRLRFNQEPNAPHDTILMSDALLQKASAEEAVRKSGAFIREVMEG